MSEFKFRPDDLVGFDLECKLKKTDTYPPEDMFKNIKSRHVPQYKEPFTSDENMYLENQEETRGDNDELYEGYNESTSPRKHMAKHEIYYGAPVNALERITQEMWKSPCTSEVVPMYKNYKHSYPPRTEISFENPHHEYIRNLYKLKRRYEDMLGYKQNNYPYPYDMYDYFPDFYKAVF